MKIKFEIVDYFTACNLIIYFSYENSLIQKLYLLLPVDSTYFSKLRSLYLFCMSFSGGH